MPGSKRVVLAIILGALICYQEIAVTQNSPQPPVPDLQISLMERLNVFNSAWETVNKHFFDPKFNGVDWAQMKVKYRPLVEAATDKSQLRDVLNKMVSELHASHTGVNGFSKGVSYNYGVDLTLVEGKWLVRATGQDSIAQHSGIERGWMLTGMEGDCVGAKRTVTVRMLDLKDQPQSVELPCGSHTFPSEPLIVRTLEGGAVYLRFDRFQPTQGKWLADQVARNMSAPAIVLDLRHNPGGAEDVAQKVVDLFFSEKTIIGRFRDRKGREVTLTARGKSAYRGRLLVLTDASTHSAAEVFAGSIQETGRGIVVGMPSGGEVLGADNFKLPNGFGLHLAIYDYHTAKGVRLEGRGVQPDVPVSMTARAFRENRDPILERVRELLLKP